MIDSLWVPGPTQPLPLKGRRVSYGCLVKDMSGWQCQRDHGKCDTHVPLTGRDGRCWQLACQPLLGGWQADRSAALPLWRNKLLLLEVDVQHRCTYWWEHLSWLVVVVLGWVDSTVMRGQCAFAHAGCFYLDFFFLFTHWQKDEEVEWRQKVQLDLAVLFNLPM